MTDDMSRKICEKVFVTIKNSSTLSIPILQQLTATNVVQLNNYIVLVL